MQYILSEWEIAGIKQAQSTVILKSQFEIGNSESNHCFQHRNC